MAGTNMSLKLLIDTKSNRVLFAEAGKDFVDFLFNILTLPLGTIVRLLTKPNMVGCLGDLYKSIENFDETYMQRNREKSSVLNPKATTNVPLLLPNVESSMARTVYMCMSSYSSNLYSPSRCSGYYSDDMNAVCPNCKKRMSTKATYVAPPGTKEDLKSSEGGYVKGVVTYMVMDDLEVKPMSTISSITILNRFKIKDVGALKEKVIHLGMNEGVKLLKATLQSKTVLTDVFLHGKKRKGA